MPYIKKEDRENVFFDKGPGSPGELTYVFYRTCLEYIGSSPQFQDFAEVLGALEACKLELYRRKIGPYEDKKIEENGDVE